MDCLAWLRNILWICGKYEKKLYDSDDPVYTSILSLQLEEEW